MKPTSTMRCVAVQLNVVACFILQTVPHVCTGWKRFYAIKVIILNCAMFVGSRDDAPPGLRFRRILGRRGRRLRHQDHEHDQTLWKANQVLI